MKCEEFIETLPDLDAAAKSGNKWCIVWFSREEDSYQKSMHMDSGDALIVIQELITKYGIEPAVLANMRCPADQPFIIELPLRP